MKRAWVWPFFFAWLLFAFGYETAWTRLQTEMNATILSTRDYPSTGVPRYVSCYQLRTLDGKVISYTAGATDASLPRSLRAGTTIVKKRWEWTSVINSVRQPDSTWIFYGVVMAGATAGLIWSLFRSFTGSGRTS